MQRKNPDVFQLVYSREVTVVREFRSCKTVVQYLLLLVMAEFLSK